MTLKSDILIIGSGITGCSVARELSRWNASVTVIDRGSDIAEGATKANSGIVHAGYDAKPGSKKAYYNVRGALMYPALCRELNVPFRQNGSLVIALNETERNIVRTLKERGEANGVTGLQLLEREEVLSLEPMLNPQIICALHIPSGAIVSPYELAYALADDAAVNGVSFHFEKNVTQVTRTKNDLFAVRAGEDTFFCKVLVNCAGASGAAVHNMLSSYPLEMIHRRGQYFLLDRSASQPFKSTIFQCPSPMGKGVLVTPTVHGNLLLGPTAEDIVDPLDTATTSEGLSEIIEKASITWPSLSVRTNITNFSGVRAHLTTDDFVVGPCEDCPGLFEAIGIESPGLSSAPAIAHELSGMIVSSLNLSAKDHIIPYSVSGKPFHDMTAEERAAAVAQDPSCGNIVCRCETVTESEIRSAIHRPVGARTIDGVKRRTRAGMGRCQGGFCLPRVAAIISEETGIPLDRITKNGGESYLLSGTLESFLKELQNDE